MNSAVQILTVLMATVLVAITSILARIVPAKKRESSIQALRWVPHAAPGGAMYYLLISLYAGSLVLISVGLAMKFPSTS
jgi:hypothetical protein